MRRDWRDHESGKAPVAPIRGPMRVMFSGSAFVNPPPGIRPEGPAREWPMLRGSPPQRGLAGVKSGKVTTIPFRSAVTELGLRDPAAAGIRLASQREREREELCLAAAGTTGILMTGRGKR